MRATLGLRGVVKHAMRPPSAPAEVSDGLFYFVWCTSKRNPRKRHATRELAETEGLRLANLQPGVRFFVYEARCVARFLK